MQGGQNWCSALHFGRIGAGQGSMMYCLKGLMFRDFVKPVRCSVVGASGQIFERIVSLRVPQAISVRSVLASFLILLCGLPALVPPFSSSELSLPACCRHNGKHRCLMVLRGMTGSHEAGPSFGRASLGCPYRSHRSQLSGAQDAPLVSIASIWLSSTGTTQYDCCTVPPSFSGAQTPGRGPPVVAEGFDS